MTGFFVCLLTVILINIADRLLSKKRDDLVIADLKQQLEEKARLAKVSAVFIKSIFKEMNLPYVSVRAGGRHYTITVDHEKCCVEFTHDNQRWPEMPESLDGILN